MQIAMDEERRKRPYVVSRLRQRHPRAYRCLWWTLVPFAVVAALVIVLVATLQFPAPQRFVLNKAGMLQTHPGEPGLPIDFDHITGIFPFSFVAHNLTLSDPNSLFIRTRDAEFVIRTRDIITGAVTIESLKLNGAILSPPPPSTEEVVVETSNPSPPWWPALGIRLELQSVDASGALIEWFGQQYSIAGSAVIDKNGGDVEIDARVTYDRNNDTSVHLKLAGSGLDQIVRLSLEMTRSGLACGAACDSPDAPLSYGNISASGTGNWYRWMELLLSRRFNLTGLIDKGVDQPVAGHAQWNGTRLVRSLDIDFAVEPEDGRRSISGGVVRLREPYGSFSVEAQQYEDGFWWMVLNTSTPGVGLRLPFIESIDGAVFYNSSVGGFWTAGKRSIPLMGDVLTAGNFTVGGDGVVQLSNIEIRTGLFELDGNVTYELGSTLSGAFRDPDGRLQSALNLATAKDGTYAVDFRIENHDVRQPGLNAQDVYLSGSFRGLPSQPGGSLSARIERIDAKDLLSIDRLTLEAEGGGPEGRAWTAALTSSGASLSGAISMSVDPAVRNGVLACTIQPFVLRARGVPLSTRAPSILAFDFSKDIYSVTADVYSTSADRPAFALEMRGDRIRVGVSEDAAVLGRLGGLRQKRLGGPVNGTFYLTELVRLIPTLANVDLCWTNGSVMDETSGSLAQNLSACLRGDPVAGWALDPLDVYLTPDVHLSLTGKVDLEFANGTLALVPVRTMATVSGSLPGLLSYSARAAASANFTVSLLD